MAHALPYSVPLCWAGATMPPRELLLRDWRKRQANLRLLPRLSTQRLGCVRLILLDPHCEIHLAEIRKSTDCFLRLVTELSWPQMVILQTSAASYG